MKTTFLMMFALVAAAGCGDTTSVADMGMSNDMTMTASFPTAPTIGATQLDRMGRAAVNTALTDPFYTDATAHGMKLDDYNQTPQAMWSKFVPQFAAALAAYDAVDGICGNQPLAAKTLAPDGGAVGEYMTLAGVLANDQMLLDTTVTNCTGSPNYLAVEIGVITASANTSCGGRTPLDNAIDVTYAAVSGGLVSGVAVTNGVTADADTANAAQLTTFPYLGAPL
jgi:hypothetical protein